MHIIKDVVNIVAVAETLYKQFEEVSENDYSAKKVLMDRMHLVRKEMTQYVGVETSERFADKFSFLYRYISDTLIIEGYTP